mgnify:CR=1 FL=1
MQNQKMMLMTPPKVEMEELKNLFFQLDNKNNNEKNKYSYFQKEILKNKEDFINIDKIKEALISLKGKKINSVYLTGEEPLAHPDFNQILRMCLKISNTTVITNGTMINDKKARFLRKIDDESQFETIYRINLDSVNEIKNDNYRGRGSYRKTINAILNLLKYEFNPIINVINYENRSEKEIFNEFQEFFYKKGFELEDINLKIIPYFTNIQNNETYEDENIDKIKLDCYTSRIITQNGVYSCCMLANDYRARLGSSIEDFSKITYLDCEKCSICIKSKRKIQVNDWM